MKIKVLMFLILLFNINTFLGQDTIRIKESNTHATVKTNLLLLIIGGAEISTEFAIAKKISIQLAANMYNIKQWLFWPSDESKCLILESRYFLPIRKTKVCNGLYLGPYSRYKTSSIYYGKLAGYPDASYKTTSLNYGITVGVEWVFKNRITLNYSGSFGTGKNLSTEIIKEKNPSLFERNRLFKQTNIDHARIAFSLGFAF